MKQINAFLSLCLDIGIPVSLDKTFDENQIIAVLGDELDSLRVESWIPQDKISKCVHKLQSTLQHNKLIVMQLQSSLGILNLKFDILLSLQAFPRRLINLAIGINKP